MKKKALGKGIGALIPQKEPVDKHDQVVRIQADLISASRFQPRMNFDSQKHAELVSSIKEKGIMQPIIVRRLKSIDGNEGFELIAGERRLRAMKELGLRDVPALIRNVKDLEALELSLVENIQREELNAIEEAHAYERLIDEFGLTQEEVAKSVGKERSTVANTLRLLKLPLMIQDYVSRGTLSMGHARALLAIADAAQQIILAEEIVKKGISVREVEQAVKSPLKKAQRNAWAADRDPHIKAAEEELQRALGTKVTIVRGKKKGKIQIDYYTAGDLERLINLLKKASGYSSYKKEANL
ncbi:MAG: ParB/RepB/Spo0J family partition protein [Candidatus Omnitrophica bacterium]|nr:ParB/RepB/Spo0J family partition protein [Candidatus Omnitrophota bacterium]